VVSAWRLVGRMPSDTSRISWITAPTLPVSLPVQDAAESGHAHTAGLAVDERHVRFRAVLAH
jgi:hypothetical protein